MADDKDRLLSEDHDEIKMVSPEQRDVWFKRTGKPYTREDYEFDKAARESRLGGEAGKEKPSWTESRVQKLEAGWTEVRGEPWVALPESEYDALIAVESHLRTSFGGWQGKSRELLDALDSSRVVAESD